MCLTLLSTGNYSRLICEIQFARSMGYYLIQIYIPASLIVIISWVSFWLHRNATPARVALGVTTVLTMTTLMSSTNAALPKISYVKSIDVYLGTCFVMVFASLVEYAAVGYLGKRIAMKRSRSIQLMRLAEAHRARCAAAAAAASIDPNLKEGREDSMKDIIPILLPPRTFQQQQQPHGDHNMLKAGSPSSSTSGSPQPPPRPPPPSKQSLEAAAAACDVSRRTGAQCLRRSFSAPKEADTKVCCTFCLFLLLLF